MTRDVRLVALIEHSGMLLAIFEGATRLRQSSSKLARRQAPMVSSVAYHVKEDRERNCELFAFVAGREYFGLLREASYCLMTMPTMSFHMNRGIHRGFGLKRWRRP